MCRLWQYVVQSWAYVYFAQYVVTTFNMQVIWQQMLFNLQCNIIARKADRKCCLCYSVFRRSVSLHVWEVSVQWQRSSQKALISLALETHPRLFLGIAVLWGLFICCFVSQLKNFLRVLWCLWPVCYERLNCIQLSNSEVLLIIGL